MPWGMKVPLFHRYTGQIKFEVLVKFLDSLYPEWRKLLAGVASDGDCLMTGRLRGVLSRRSEEALLELYRIWCGLQWFILLMQQVYFASLEEDFYSILTSVIGHLRIYSR